MEDSFVIVVIGENAVIGMTECTPVGIDACTGACVVANGTPVGSLVTIDGIVVIGDVEGANDCDTE